MKHSAPDRRLRREIVAVLAVKIAALFLLWALFFGPDHRAAVDNAAMERALLPQDTPLPGPRGSEQ